MKGAKHLTIHQSLHLLNFFIRKESGLYLGSHLDKLTTEPFDTVSDNGREKTNGFNGVGYKKVGA